MLYSLDWQELIGPVVTLVVIGGLLRFLLGYLKNSSNKRRQSVKSARLQSRASGGVRDTLHGNRSAGKSIETVSAVDSGGDFFRQRERVKQLRRRQENAARDQISEREDNTDRGLDDWAKHEEAKQRRIADREAAEQEAERQRMTGGANLAADPLVQAWAETSGADLHDTRARPIDKAMGAAYDVLIGTAEEISKESDNLDFIIDKLETSVDFISMEFNDAVARWKTGEAFRSNSLNDLKHRFRLKTFSLEDAWELVFSYPDWIRRQRKTIAGYVGKLGTPAESEEALDAQVARALQSEWDKDLDVNMDVVMLLKEAEKMVAQLQAMENRLEKLKRACDKRSGQVIAPAWEPRKLAD